MDPNPSHLFLQSIFILCMKTCFVILSFFLKFFCFFLGSDFGCKVFEEKNIFLQRFDSGYKI